MAVFRKAGRFKWPGRSDPKGSGADPARPDTVLADDPAARAGPGPGTEAGLAEGLSELVEGAERPVGAWHVAEYHVERGRGRALVAGVARRLGGGGRVAARGAVLGGKALTEQLMRTAPRIPVRDLATLRAQHPDAADPEHLADLLVAGATRAAAALGAGVGAAAMLPVPPAMAVEIAAETLAVAAVEVKLIAELHEVYGVPAQGSATQRAGAYLGAWANRRGIDAMLLTRPAGFAALALGAEVRQQVRRRLARSWMRRLPSVTPLLLGAGVGATVNRRDTRRLAGQVRDDLCSRRPTNGGYWAAAGPVIEGEVAP
ncbi:hypothetical protein [Streptomyces sp. CBMA123]|uniref:hypothetical protein n=1 Tax=Streptomyces sp. CBMA123 TaxID=1896313 RepID=UPI001CB7E0D8|nr:hypothetical protein [Streptomyces sp. CBMA123]MBD0689610.1 hypothetical protein [Streptomyces sp. CBMA123]